MFNRTGACNAGRTAYGANHPVREEITYRSLLRHNCINCSSVLVRTQAAREFPMCHEDSHEDYIAWLGILKKYKRAVAVNEPLLKYRLTGSGKSGNKIKSAKDLQGNIGMRAFRQ